MSVPLLVRPNSIIAVGNDDTKPDYDYADGVVFHVFEIEDKAFADASVYDTSGNPALHVYVKREGRRIFVDATGESRGWSICLRGIGDVETVSGGDFVTDEMGVKVIPDENGKIEVILKE